MAKLVEEVVISSDVLVDVLVQVGFLDKAFEDGNVSRIDSSYGRDGANTYSITVEKEVRLNSIENLSSEQLMEAKEMSNECDEGRDEIKYKWCDKSKDMVLIDNKPVDEIVDLLAYLKESVDNLNSNNTPLNIVIDVLNNDKCTAEKFTKEFMNKVNTIKGGF